MERLGQSVIGVDSRENGISGNGHSLYRQLLEFCCKREQKKKKLRLWLLGDVGSWDFFSPPWEGKMGGVAACMYILRGDAPKMRTFIMQEEEGKL